MTARLFIVWDYDGAVGHINATYPYNFNEEAFPQEIENVEKILEKSKSLAIPMVFAVTGFSAEPGTYPYHIPEQIKKIYDQGHEIASHSWRHEWLPYLQAEQLEKTLKRSKMILEKCIGKEGAVQGFVPPFNRPMTWLRKGAYSRGDRAFGKFFPGSDLNGLIDVCSKLGYRWVRTCYRPLVEKLLRKNGNRDLTRVWSREKGVLCVPNNYTGFDEAAHSLLDLAINKQCDLLVSGHPGALSRKHSESEENFNSFLEHIAKKREEGSVKIELLKDACL